MSKVPDFKAAVNKIFGNDTTEDNETCICKKNISYECTIREERELDLKEQGLTYDLVNGCWAANYLWLRVPKDLLNNFALQFQE